MNTSPTLSPAQGLPLLDALIRRLEKINAQPEHDQAEVRAWGTYATTTLGKIFGDTSAHIHAVINATAGGGTYGRSMKEDIREKNRRSVLAKIKQLRALKEILELEIELAAAVPAVPNGVASLAGAPALSSRKVFIVHGRHDAVRESMARFLGQLGLDPIILHEQANEGRTIIQKFTDHADVGFAVVLLTGDDEGRLKGSDEAWKPRARQNVILELGYFLGRLPAKHVCALYESGTELPTDFSGVLFVPYDAGGAWKAQLFKELRAAGMAVDAEKFFSL